MQRCTSTLPTVDNALIWLAALTDEHLKRRLIGPRSDQSAAPGAPKHAVPKAAGHSRGDPLHPDATNTPQRVHPILH
jgi:hypothetical protein